MGVTKIAARWGLSWIIQAGIGKVLPVGPTAQNPLFSPLKMGPGLFSRAIGLWPGPSLCLKLTRGCSLAAAWEPSGPSLAFHPRQPNREQK